VSVFRRDAPIGSGSVVVVLLVWVPATRNMSSSILLAIFGAPANHVTFALIIALTVSFTAFAVFLAAWQPRVLADGLEIDLVTIVGLGGRLGSRLGRWLRRRLVIVFAHLRDAP